MSDALFLADIGSAGVGQVVAITGAEARHAATVKRIRVGEQVMVADGDGRGVRGVVESVEPGRVVVSVREVLSEPQRALTVTAVQALAKGDRSELAVEMLTEVGATAIVAWQASRSVVRWQGERGDKALAKWAATAREAAKQSRRLRVPQVRAATTAQLRDLLASADVALVLHEDATLDIWDVALPVRGSVVLVVGPEGGIAPDELSAFEAAGARAVRISDGVLRTSTAGAVAVGQLMALSGSVGGAA